MKLYRRAVLTIALSALAAVSTHASAMLGDEKYQPQVGQEGKDVIWVPTSDALVKKMLETAKVTSSDLVYDLGAGDGKIPIAAAKDFGATAVGIEYNAEMAALARRNASRAGVADKVKIITGDIFKEDFSKATVVTMYLLPDLNLKLRPTLLKMKPGTRIVSHAFTMGDWEPDQRIDTEMAQGYFWIVPASVGGRWTLSGIGTHKEVTLQLSQRYQAIGGTMTMNKKTQPILSPTLQGDRLTFGFIDEQDQLHTVKAKITGHHLQADVSAGSQFYAIKGLHHH